MKSQMDWRTRRWFMVDDTREAVHNSGWRADPTLLISAPARLNLFSTATTICGHPERAPQRRPYPRSRGCSWVPVIPVIWDPASPAATSGCADQVAAPLSHDDVSESMVSSPHTMRSARTPQARPLRRSRRSRDQGEPAVSTIARARPAFADRDILNRSERAPSTPPRHASARASDPGDLAFTGQT